MMNQDYNPSQIEPKWRKTWEETKIDRAQEDSDRPKHYQLEFFPYPSGVTMHVGHVRNYVMSDVFGRFQRMSGKNVLHPMGWDAFGLPAENQAIKTGLPPRQSTDQNIEIFKRQLSAVGLSYDWSREIDSSKPDYYRWTQWFFLLFYKRSLAYKAEALVNWCPHDKTVLANEQVIKQDGKNVCERCGHEVEKRNLNQWFFKITEYADRLLADLDGLDWPENIKTMQRNWIGRSRGATVRFAVADSKETIEVFTTRVDTIYGATFMVLAPEHPLVDTLATTEQKSAVEAYRKQAQNQTEIERQSTDRTKTGVFTGSYAINPATDEKIPIWVADYVLMGYGTGAVMAVPAHDDRDHEFAGKFKLPIKPVVSSDEAESTTSDGKLINSDQFNGLTSAEARKQICRDLDSATATTNYRMRDWLISRQRYWGAPIPIVYCQKCGVVPVPEDQLPVVLPELENFQPDGSGRSPLARATDWLQTDCPQCGGPAERETDTLDTFVDSSWYYLRFADPHNNAAAFDPAKVAYWLPVDTYVGGAEHAVAHLLFARFWTKVLADAGLVDFQEPFLRLRNQGLIGGADGRKMGKRYGNVVTPDDIIGQGYGADALRLYELFIGPYNQNVDWNPRGIDGTQRFIKRVWALVYELTNEDSGERGEGQNSELETALVTATHRTIKKVSDDLGDFGFNTAVAALMEYVNELYKLKVNLPLAANRAAWRLALRTLTQLVAPMAPFVSEELWQALGEAQSVHVSEWPQYEEKYLRQELVEIIIQVNGKLRGNLTAAPDTADDELKRLAAEVAAVKKYLEGQTIKKTIVVPRKLVNFVI